MNAIKIAVNGTQVAAVTGASLLQTLLAAGIDIPHMCYHHPLPPQGRCSLCLVEQFINEQWQLKHACQMQCHAGMIIRTESQRITEMRGIAAALLLRRGPFKNSAAAEQLQRLASPQSDPAPDNASSAPNATPKAQQPMSGCILCGLCVAVCAKIGRSYLTFLGRGQKLTIGYVLGKECGTCRACQNICPTGFIHDTGEQTFHSGIYIRPQQSVCNEPSEPGT